MSKETGEQMGVGEPEESYEKKNPFKSVLESMEKQYIVAYGEGFGFSVDLGRDRWKPAPYVDDPNDEPFDYRASMQVYAIKTESDKKQWVIMGIKQCDWPKGALKDITEILGVTNEKPTTEELKRALESSSQISKEAKSNLDKILANIGGGHTKQ